MVESLDSVGLPGREAGPPLLQGQDAEAQHPYSQCHRRARSFSQSLPAPDSALPIQTDKLEIVLFFKFKVLISSFNKDLRGSSLLATVLVTHLPRVPWFPLLTQCSPDFRISFLNTLRYQCVTGSHGTGVSCLAPQSTWQQPRAGNHCWPVTLGDLSMVLLQPRWTHPSVMQALEVTKTS